MFLVNPLTVVPIFYTAYRVGAAVLGAHHAAFRFQLSFDWLQYGLGPLWKPFLWAVSSAAALAATVGWIALELCGAGG